MRVAWTRSAIADLAGIYEYIAKDFPRYALTVIDRLTKRTVQIAQFPYSGELVPEYTDKQI
jgi:toxin ParE1/3/4